MRHSRLLRHFIQYVLLASGLGAFAFLHVFYQGQLTMQFLTLLMASGFYIVWGTLHHWLEDRLNLHVMLEYYFIAAFVVILSFYLLSL